MDKEDIEKSLEARSFNKNEKGYENYSIESRKYDAIINENGSIFLNYEFQKTGVKGSRLIINIKEFEALWD